MAQPPPFLTVPREIRDLIYREFLLIDAEDGYVYNPETGKLRTAKEQPIDLTPMYTCRQIAAEMVGAPLRLHTITFTTNDSRQAQRDAMKWEHIITHQWQAVQSSLDFVLPWTCGKTDSLTGMSDGDRALCGADQPFQSLFTHQKIQRNIIRHLMATNADIENFFSTAHWTDNLSPSGPNDPHDHDPLRFLNVGMEPWKIPTEDEMNCTIASSAALLHVIDKISNPIRTDSLQMGGDYDEPCKIRRFSAAASAIHWFHSIPSSAREHVRNILVHEDRASSAYPETHTQGLISLCEQYPQMKVERRVDIWDAVWSFAGGGEPLQDTQPPVYDAEKRGRWATALVAGWMNEASASPSNFTLVFKAYDCPERAELVFHAFVQRDVAWQVAFEEAFKSKYDNSFDAFRAPPQEPYFGKKFPALVGSLGERSSRIRCNFDTGTAWTDAQLPEIPKVQNASEAMWVKMWLKKRTKNYRRGDVTLEAWGTAGLAHIFRLNHTLEDASLIQPRRWFDKEALKWAKQWLGIKVRALPASPREVPVSENPAPPALQMSRFWALSNTRWMNDMW
ncbi:hypothetical protein QBC34DRAFT_477586 [Podospora aff. communis PSN243]|uniref:Uncharacterized protein n=1 Tax=Podospora aff. communis PSN243 TaxID=3040156 RepID=A0AAV9G605_9PEZI|nr:hypothetical protein QBC34DRAFT_477586 [Podospora aff. communis PSN243]